ncbi:MAG: hypothetical protein AB1427_01645 [Thermodesulfobacteriota bacterium]
MKTPTLVCPYSRPLLDRIAGYAMVVRVDRFADISRAADEVRSAGKTLQCVLVESEMPLNAIDFQKDWQGIPIALSVPAMGAFREIADRVRQLADLKVHVYLPAAKRENLTASRMLASLDVTCCLVFDSAPPHWEALADLMTYALFGSNPHAPVEPFNYLAEHYRAGADIDWGAVYFDDSAEFLHLDADGRVALSWRELCCGAFIAEDISLLGDPSENALYRNSLNTRRALFLNGHPCIACEGWKVCLGRFGADGKHRPGCAASAADLLGELEHYRNQQLERA